MERINKDVNIDDVHNLMDSLVEAREDIDEIGGALATEIIPDSNLFDQGLFLPWSFHWFHSIFLELEDELENLLKSEEKDDIADLMNSCAISANIPSPGGAGDTLNADLVEDNLPTDLLWCLTHSRNTSLTFNLFTCKHMIFKHNKSLIANNHHVITGVN